MKRLIYSLGILLVFIGIMLGCVVNDDFCRSFIPETEKEVTQTQINGYIYKPALVPATDERVHQLKVPEGFIVEKFAEELGKPRMIATSSGGHVYVSDREAGEVMLLEDTNGDGAADRSETVANIKQAHGLTIHNDKLYIVSVREIFSADINADGTLNEPMLLTDTLPDGGNILTGPLLLDRIIKCM
jgi:glucose/arabinose dehydrogenase